MKFEKSVRVQILQEIENGATIRDVMREYGVSRASVYAWVAEERRRGVDVSPARVEQLQLELKRCKQEIEILQKAGCSAKSPREIRKEAFVRLSHEYPLKVLARVLNISVGSAHYQRDRRVEVKQIELEDIELSKVIQETFIKNRKCYGKRRIRAILNRKNIVVSERRVARLMREMNLVSTHTTYRWQRTSPRRVYYPNRLKRQFTQEAPNQAWTADCTYIRVGNEWFFACAIIDLFARKVVGWDISEHKTALFIKELFVTTFASRGNPKNLIFHADQGVEFIEFSLKQCLRAKGVTLSYSSVGSPLDNAVSESFFSTVKKEFIQHQNYRDKNHLREELASYIDWYNEERLHSTNGNCSPNEVENEYNAAQDYIYEYNPS